MFKILFEERFLWKKNWAAWKIVLCSKAIEEMRNWEIFFTNIALTIQLESFALKMDQKKFCKI